MDPVIPIVALSILPGSLIALLFFGNYFRQRRSEVVSISHSEFQPPHHKKRHPNKPPPPSWKTHNPKSTGDKVQNKRCHPLDLNTLKGPGDSVMGLCLF
ncbi:hypothetical protein MLD38_018722 [Melastoma candidum]|uniref:Uncharacterized protein n=1 Tax=Melastoma candidum TaxID=119954 RepID=A0ACB9QUM6_9MYRT|nr:hypothetical protein MLD38_018722 [Melastoma candidum]